jgi:putative tryptophan/tyrosine transport system substrate-binding protein
VNRRAFIAGLGSAVAWPLAARAQQVERVRQIGVLMLFGENEPEGKALLAGFTQRLAELGWTDGRTMRMHVRWTASSIDRTRTFAKELVDLRPDVILANGTPATAALQRETRTIPIVFAIVGDPVGDGFVASLARPGGNMTGFIPEEAGMAGKLLQLLTEIAPGVKQVAIMFNPDTAPGGDSLYYLPAFEAGARLSKAEPITAPVHSDAEIETVMTSLARVAGGGLVVSPDGFTLVHRAAIITQAARYNVPAVYGGKTARDGALLCYGPDLGDIFRRAAPYVDRILRGAKPAELPVQLPVKFQMALNVKTANALGLAIPPTLLAVADEVIE